VRNADIGFRRDGLIIVKGLGDVDVAPHSEALLDAFRRVRGVVSATGSNRYPATESESATSVELLGNPAVQPTLTTETIGSDYPRTYDLHLVAGRFLGQSLRADDFSRLRDIPPAQWQLNVIVNESAAHALGFPDASKVLGQRVSFGRIDAGGPLIADIVGVVKDVRFMSPRSPSAPQVYLQDNRLAGATDHDSGWSLAVRVRESDRAAVTEQLEQIWRTMVPGVPFRAESVAAAMKPYYDPDERRGQLFASGAILSGLIACLGLYGLAAFNTARRFKEIGIRKTLGASAADIVRLLMGQFLRPVVLANLAAWPLAYLALRAYLTGFDQRIALSPAYFLTASAMTLAIAVVTVAGQALFVARAPPSKALRHD
jgi:putative ABC transport system permease protein